MDAGERAEAGRGLLMVTDNFLVLNRYLDFLNRFAI